VSVAVPVMSVAVLAVEVELARRGEDLPDGRPYQVSGPVGSGDGPALRMVWLGDSTAAGVGASSAATALPSLVAKRISATQGRRVELLGLAVSGARIADVRESQVGRVPADTDIVLVSIGSNDVTHLTRRSTFRSTYEDVLERLPERTEVVLLGVPDFGAPPRLSQPLRAVAGRRGRTLGTTVVDLARSHRAAYVDIAAETGPTFRSQRERMFADDGYHPSDAGYRLWSDAVVPVVEDVLDER